MVNCKRLRRMLIEFFFLKNIFCKFFRRFLIKFYGLDLDYMIIFNLKVSVLVVCIVILNIV